MSRIQNMQVQEKSFFSCIDSGNNIPIITNHPIKAEIGHLDAAKLPGNQRRKSRGTNREETEKRARCRARASNVDPWECELLVEGPIGGKKKNSRKAKPSPFLPHHFELSICFSLLLFSSFVGERSALSRV